MATHIANLDVAHQVLDEFQFIDNEEPLPQYPSSSATISMPSANHHVIPISPTCVLFDTAIKDVFQDSSANFVNDEKPNDVQTPYWDFQLIWHALDPLLYNSRIILYMLLSQTTSHTRKLILLNTRTRWLP